MTFMEGYSARLFWEPLRVFVSLVKRNLILFNVYEWFSCLHGAHWGEKGASSLQELELQMTVNIMGVLETEPGSSSAPNHRAVSLAPQGKQQWDVWLKKMETSKGYLPRQHKKVWK